MTKAAKKEQFLNKIKNQNTEMLKDIAESLMSDFRDGADIVHEEVMNELETRMSEKAFVGFCNRI